MNSVEKNKAIVETYVSAMNERDFTKLRAVFHDDARIEGVTGAAPVDEAMIVWRALTGSLNMTLKVEGMVAEGDIVVVRFTESGRWTAPFYLPAGGTWHLTLQLRLSAFEERTLVGEVELP